jgi:tetratricopeptide (TPR) repeat protein
MKSKTTLRQSLFVFICLVSFLSHALGQGTEKLKELFVEAESYFLFEEYKDALPIYQRILQMDPENYNINYKIGICYLNDIYQVQKSIPYLEKAVQGISPECKTNSYKERRSPPESFYYLGNAYRANNKLDEAIKTYEEFKQILDPVVYDAALVDEQIASCKVAADQERKPMYFISVNLGEGINDRFEELNPLISGDERVLVFTRKLQFYDAVFYSRKDNGKWSEPVNLTPAFGVDGNCYSTGLSYNGDELYVYRSDNFDGNLYVSKYRNGTWSKLEKLNGNINTKYWESHASLSKDGKTLYFTSNREGGYGGLDIYKSERKRGGEWGPAINLGPVINTRYNEDTPFLTDDGSTLYFSSMGHYNMGGYDIFYSTRLDNGQWAKPLNAGYPLNTTRDDIFFVPLRDGAYAYYAKYDPSDSYGMMDIYKLEVFTDLHPRKFILNGVTRVEGQLKPDFTAVTATLVNAKTGQLVDQTRLNPDGTYTLDAYSGDFELQIKGKDISDNIEKLTIPVNNSSNIIAHSSLLKAAPSEAVAGEVVAAAEITPAVGPEMIIPIVTYNVTSDASIPIKLDLEKNTTLQVETLVNGESRKTESFDIKRRRFVYMLKPEAGTNILRFTLTDAAGNSTTREVTVLYTPSGEAVTTAVTAEESVLSDADRYMGITAMAAGNLDKFLRSLDLRGSQFQTIADLYDYLIQHAEEYGFTPEEVQALMARFLSQKDLNFFYGELFNQAPDSLKKTLAGLDLSGNNVYSSEALVDYLVIHAPGSNYNLDELREALYRIAEQNRDPLTFIRLMESYSTGDLSKYLEKMRQNSKDYPNTRAAADYIMKGAEDKMFPLSELDEALKKAALDIDVHFLSQGLIFISADSLRQTLLDLNMDKQQIRNSYELITYLLAEADHGGYSRRELLENIEKIRKDPYYYVELFRKMLAQKATGSLKVFLQEIDIRGLEINTFEELVDYLLNQSQFHDFNREMVYQLLIDIIDPKSVSEFVELLKRYGDDRITKAIEATNTEQFSKPLEVMQYLLSVADEFNYTERDLLRVLLKMLLRKGPDLADGSEKEGWFSGLDKPALITSLVVVNAIIIALLILFILRKKRKNE